MKSVLLCLSLMFAALGLIAVAPAVAASPSQAITEVDAKIEIVWPHGNVPVTQASFVNITAYLFEPGTLRSVPCDFNPTVRLWQSTNNEPVANVAVGQRRLVTRGGITFPVWDFNNINVVATRNPENKHYFYVTVDGVTTNFNIWSHAADARTYLPQPRRPNVATGRPEAVDARIQIVWPHDRAGVAQPVSRATLVNVQVALFNSGTLASVGRDFDQRVHLFRGLNNDPVQLVGQGAQRLVTQNGVTYPVWEFNDVDVSAARDGLNKYYFRILVDDTRTFSTIWSHGADARTYFPRVDQPTAGCGTGAAASVSISPTRGLSGTTVQIAARDFPANVAVQVYGGPQNSEGVLIGSGRTDGAGVFIINYVVQGANGMRWGFAVATNQGCPTCPVRAESEPFLITGQQPAPNLKYLWPNTYVADLGTDPRQSWADEAGWLLKLTNSPGGAYADILGGSAAQAAHDRHFRSGTAGRAVNVRGYPATLYPTEGAWFLTWQEEGQRYVILSPIRDSELLTLATNLGEIDLTTFLRRLGQN